MVKFESLIKEIIKERESDNKETKRRNWLTRERFLWEKRKMYFCSSLGSTLTFWSQFEIYSNVHLILDNTIMNIV